MVKSIISVSERGVLGGKPNFAGFTVFFFDSYGMLRNIELIFCIETLHNYIK